jgi:hypothetical protein
MGQGYGNSIQSTETENTYQTLDLGQLPSPEFKLLYRLTIQVKTNFLNTLKCRIVNVADYRGVDDSSLGRNIISELDDMELKMKINIDEDDIDTNITYVGEALPGTLDSDAIWSIKRMQVVGEDLFITWAESDADYIHVWNDRKTYSYN